MTHSHPTSTRPGALVLASPAALVAGIRYLLGFAPSDSAVLLWLDDGQLVLTQRLDLPAARDIDAWAAAVWAHAGAAASDEVIAAFVDPVSAVGPVADRLVVDARERGMRLRDLLEVRDGRWRSLLCVDPACCDPDGQAVDAAVSDAVAAEFAVVGVAPLPRREDLVASFAADDAAAARVTALLGPGRPSGSDVEDWRDRAIAHGLAALARSAASPASDADIAAVLDGLVDVRVRDTVLWELMRRPRAGLHAAVAALVPIVRAAPGGFVAPAATCAAICAWLVGDGARARIALDRALADNPDYTMAALVDGALSGGMPPSGWREAMSGLTRADCRHGQRERRNASRA